MKILIYGINFAPELTGTGKYTGEMAAWLVKQGHDVSVITAPPYYPQWQVQPGYQQRRYTLHTWHGVKVYRAPLWVPAIPSGAKRILHLVSFALTSLPVLLYCARQRPDVVMVIEPPLFCTPAAIAVARLCGARSWLHIQDYEVDAAFELGLLKGHTLKKWVSRLERWLMQRFDRISTISSRMLARARNKGVDDDKLVLFPNWIDITTFKTDTNQNTPWAQTYRGELGIPTNAIVAMYAGNLGGKQGLSTLAEVAQILRRRQDIHFIFCGEGPTRLELQRRCVNLAQVHFLPLQPAERLGELLTTADVHLLPQRAGAADLVMPSKLTGMLASGRPVICGAAPNTELAEVVAHCGIVVTPESSWAMARALLKLANHPARRLMLGQAARRYAQSYLHKETVLARFEQALEKIKVQRAILPKTP
jgi:colanic acid biosynthesis glycosyl transferase WcaI